MDAYGRVLEYIVLSGLLYLKDIVGNKWLGQVLRE